MKNTKYWRGWKAIRALMFHSRRYMRTNTLENQEYLFKLNLSITYDPAILLLGIFSKQVCIYVHLKTCTRTLLAAPSVVAKN